MIVKIIVLLTILSTIDDVQGGISRLLSLGKKKEKQSNQSGGISTEEAANNPSHLTSSSGGRSFKRFLSFNKKKEKQASQTEGVGIEEAASNPSHLTPLSEKQSNQSGGISIEETAGSPSHLTPSSDSSSESEIKEIDKAPSTSKYPTLLSGPELSNYDDQPYIPPNQGPGYSGYAGPGYSDYAVVEAANDSRMKQDVLAAQNATENTFLGRSGDQPYVQPNQGQGSSGFYGY